MNVAQFTMNFFAARNHSVLTSKLELVAVKMERCAQYLPEAAHNRWRFVKAQAEVAIDSGMDTDRALTDLRAFERNVSVFLEF